jgi:hypothetical protein
MRWMILLMIVLSPATMSPAACKDKSPPTIPILKPPVASFMIDCFPFEYATASIIFL